MDDEPVLDCIVVADRTDLSSTMAPGDEQPSASPKPDAAKVGDAARGVPKQSQTRTTSSSGSTAAIPPSRYMPGKNTAVSDAPSKGLPPATGAGPAAKRPPAFPSIRPPASRSPSSISVHERSHKRTHKDAFPSISNRDRGQQPAPHKKDQPKKDENPGQLDSRHNSARFEVISISSDNDEDHDSDDEPLLASRHRKATSGTPNPSERQQRKQASSDISARPSSTAPTPHLRANTSQRSNAEPWPSTAQDSTQAGHVSRTSSEYRGGTGMSEGSQSSQGSKRLRTDVPLTYECFFKNIGSRSSQKTFGVDEGPKKADASADDIGKDRVSTTTTRLGNENQELKFKLEQQTTEINHLAKQLRESRALSKGTSQSKLVKEREFSTLKEELGAREKEIKVLLSEKVGLTETITQLRDEVSQEKEDANQSNISHQKQMDYLQKLLDDRATHCMKLEATVKGHERKQEASKDTAAEITRLQATNRKLKEKNLQLEGENSQLEGGITEVKDQYSQLKDEKSYMMVQNDQLQSRLKDLEHELQQKSAEHVLAGDATKRQIEELQGQMSSQRDEIREYERRVADLREEVDWYKGNRERMKKEWEERGAMEMKWHDDLQALRNDPKSFVERRRAALAAADPVHQAAQRDAQRDAPQQQATQQQPTQQQATQQQPAQQWPAQQQPAQRQSAQRRADKPDASRGESSRGGGGRGPR